jgi:hypothetical protein
MKAMLGRLWAQSTKPVDTWSGWALTTLFIAILMVIIGWFYDDYRTALVCGAGATAGVASRVLYVTTVGKRRRQRRQLGG